jgi:ABC-type transporter Mla subunit MlaD
MATLNDAYNQLVQANSQLTTLHNDLQEVNTSVDASTAAIESGFSGLDQLVEYTNQLLAYEIEQNQTIICNLEKIAKQTCELVNEATLQTAAQQAMRDDLHDLKQLYELTNPAAAGEQRRLEALNRKIEACCPPPVPEPPCRYEPCKRPGKPPPPPGGGPIE